MDRDRQADAPGCEVRAFLRLYGCEGEEAEQVLAVAREARMRESHRVPEWVRAYVGLEAEAVAALPAA
jgi:hypothetical protein